jgi:hypothetical protein
VSKPGLRDLLEGAAAGLAALAVMAGAAVLALHLLDADASGPLAAMTAAVVALAGGGSVTLGMEMGGSSVPISAGLGGDLSVVPLGLTALGAIALAACFLLPLRRRLPLSGGALALRAAGALGLYVTGLAIAAAAGHGKIKLGGTPGTGTGADPRAGGLPGLGDILRNRGNRGNGGNGNGNRNGGDREGLLGGLLGNRPGGGSGGRDLLSGGDLTFASNVAGTVYHGLFWAALLLAFCWLASRHTPLPVAWRRLDRNAIRPAVSALATVTVVWVLLGLLAGLVLGLVAPNGGRAGAGVMLALPNALVVLLTVGLGVPWRVDAGGNLADRLLPALEKRLPVGDGGDWTLSLGTLSGMDRPVWLLPVAFSALTLLACGVLTAVRARRTGPVLGRALRNATVLGILLGILLPLLTAATGAAANIGISVLGFSLSGATLDISGNVWAALGSGLLGGALAGLVGSLLTDLAGTAWTYRHRNEEPAPS